MAWSLFGGNRGKYDKLNSAGFEMFDAAFGVIINKTMGINTEQFLNSISDIIDSDYEQTYTAARRGSGVATLGPNISMQLSAFLFEHRKNPQVVDREDSVSLFMSGVKTALQQIARITFGWSPAIAKAFGNNSMSVGHLIMKTTLDLVPDRSLYDEDDGYMFGVYEGYKFGYDTCIKYCESR
jgi:hypothetical protein